MNTFKYYLLGLCGTVIVLIGLMALWALLMMIVIPVLICYGIDRSITGSDRVWLAWCRFLKWIDRLKIVRA